MNELVVMTDQNENIIEKEFRWIPRVGEYVVMEDETDDAKVDMTYRVLKVIHHSIDYNDVRKIAVELRVELMRKKRVRMST